MPRYFYRWMPRSLGRQLMLLTAICLVASILGYGAYTAKRQTDLARQTISAQMAALAKNLATVNAYFLTIQDFASIEAITVQTATVPGILSVLVTDIAGTPLSEVVNQNGQWTPRFSAVLVEVPYPTAPLTEEQPLEAGATQQGVLTAGSGKFSAWHPIGTYNPMGWVRVTYRLDSFDQTARNIWTQALLVIVLAISATLFLLALLLRPSMRALRQATRFAGELDHALGTKMEVSHGSHETEALGQALNQVSARLLAQNIDLNNQKFALDQHAIVSITDLNGTITYANERFCNISGYAREELIGANHRMVRSGEHGPEVFTDLWTTISQGKVWNGELKNRRKDGSFYWVASTIVPLMGADGLPQQYIGIRTDITANKELEQSLQVAKLAADAANQAKSEFLANMSHEIRTPMNGVIGMTDLALDTTLDATQRNYLNTVKSSAQSLLVILNDILDFSKIEAGKLAIEHVPFDLPQLVADVLASMEARTTAKGLTLTRVLAPGLPPQVLGDPGRIRQVLTNLCDNAIKFTQQGGLTVQLAINRPSGTGCEVQLSVRDTGLGIAPAKQQLIFAAFSQADSSTTRHYGGTGLGLTICARLVEMMGGRIWVDSAPGQGSTFHFTVQLECPAANATPPVAADSSLSHPMPSNTIATIAAPAPAPTAQRPLLVLLAEDHPVNQLLATTLLKKWQHSVVLAKNGQEAVDLYPTQAWDVVLMDMQMPVMSGLEAAQGIRALEAAAGARRVPIIAVTANAMEADRDACLSAGMDDHLAKPLNAAALQAMMARYCPPRTAP